MAAHSQKNAEFFAWAGGVTAAFEAANKDGTLKAMGREAIKDIRNTIHEVAFGRPEGHSEPGTPLNPTAGEIADDRREDMHPYGFSQSGVDYSMSAAPAPDSPLPSPSDIANDRDIQPKTPNGQVYTQEQDGGWADRIEKQRPASGGSSNGGNGGNRDGSRPGYDRQKERILPEEERQKEREQDQGRGGGRC